MGLFPEEEIEENVGAVPRCAECGSERVVKDAWACWNPAAGMWELEETFDQAHCHQCEAETRLVWSAPPVPSPLRIRELNDRLRCEGRGNGRWVVTSGVQACGDEFVQAAILAVRDFDDFSNDNDPHGEHDFGAVDVYGERLFFKIDYYAPDLSAGSENPANEGLTHRVLTVMLALEY